MKLKSLGYAAVVAATAAAFMIGSAGVGEAKGKKKTAAAMSPPMGICVLTYEPVCAVKGGMKFTYSNACFAKNDGAKVVSDKACPPKKAMKAGKGKKTVKKAIKKK
jgi:hypothetical protein